MVVDNIIEGAVMKTRVLLIEVFLALLCSLSFIACENFLDGENVKDELIREIYISNHDCPEATVEEPAFSDAGVAKNKAIIVSFTMPMDPGTFSSSYQITDSIGNNLQPNFMEPQWSNDNTVVTIAANELNLIDLHGKKTLDIYFTLSKNCTSTDGLPINSAVNHKYRINETVDNTPPSMTDNVYVERPVITYMDNEISSSARLMEGSLTSENEFQICNTNHINSTINVYIEGSDYGGGAVKGHIVCRRVSEVTGNKVNEEPKDFIFNLSKLDDSDESGGSFYLNLSSSDYEDGMYEVKLFIQDSSGMDSEDCKTYYVIRDTSLAYCLTSRIVNDTPYFTTDYPDPSPDDQENGYEPGEYESKLQQQIFNRQPATLQKIQDFRNRILFDQINDDVYYTSNLTNKTYAENDLTYFVSWGLDKEQLTTPVQIQGKFYLDNAEIAQNIYVKYYTLPSAFHTFLNNNEDKDIILKAIVLDSVGNQNVIYSLWPKKIDFYNYSVFEDDDNKKKIQLNFADVANNKTFEDKIIHGKWRIFYAPLGTHEPDDDLTEVILKRNAKENEQYNDSTDFTEIKGLEADSKYVVYIQTAYDADSVYNGQYNCTTFGPLIKVIVDTSKTTEGIPLKPVFTSGDGETISETTNIINRDRVTKGEINSSEVNITITLTNESYDSNLTYIPYYQVLVPRHWAEDENHQWRWYEDDFEWVKLEPQTEKTFTITVRNSLIAPLCKGKAWDCEHWDMRVQDYDEETQEPYGPDNTYFEAVENCRLMGIEYTPVKAALKIQAANGTDFTESDEIYVEFYEEDDNIPPKLSNEITRHDSHLSFDGHAFEFKDLIREDEGNLTEYFTYYYTTYNHAWGDNLNVLSESQIQMLPSGRAKFTGSCWLDKTSGADYSLDTSIPVYGLPDGEYMYFAKLEDRYGNYTYATLGKAHIGTFKNKLKVELDKDGNYFKSTLELEPEESFFDRNIISVQVYWDTWDNYYEWLNELQNCRKENNRLSSYIPSDTDLNDFIYRKEEGDKEVYYDYKEPKRDFGKTNQTEKILEKHQWYRITMQSFNYCNDVNFRYGRPYTSLEEVRGDENNLWNSRLGWVNGEQKYDVCTDETISNTVYYFVPDEDENFSDYYASFFAGTATPRSNHSLLVNVFASSCDLGNDPDEWERRGKLVATHRYNPRFGEDCDFNQNVAAEDVSKAREHGLVYYAAVAHFAKGESAVSDVYTMYGF